ncbi:MULTISPECIES: hypothetical protein [unclassified Yoonia]|uniref:hypothetical protein n=1 Tax=unclassified Yoonia TaxID=2629118 RepID=UPI002AFE2C39|nr:MULTISPECIES: hypothetical protein [unclassified Yoonia]
MHPVKTALAAALLAVLASTSVAETQPAQVMAAPVVMDNRAPAGSSPAVTYVVIGVLAVLLIGAALQMEDSQRRLRDFDPTETE